jgi:ABC-type uncharacterized transport system substrate-binding protein
VTGVANLNAEVGPKRLELLHAMVPAATTLAVLVDPTVPALVDAFTRPIQAAAGTLEVTLHVLHASAEEDFERVFAEMTRLRAGGLVIGPGTLFAARGEQIGALAFRHAVPAVFQYRPFVAAGGLMSYGASEIEYYRLVGLYVGEILKGAKPGDLPVQQSSKVELIINLKTAKALGLAVPLPLLASADEVIE